MKILKRCGIGFLSGCLFAFITFVLISPAMRSGLIGIVLWGIQGTIFVVCWDLVNIIVKSFHKNTLVFCAIKGGISGVGASFLSTFISLQSYHQYQLPESAALNSLYFDLSLFTLGCLCFGAVIGMTFNKCGSGQA